MSVSSKELFLSGQGKNKQPRQKIRGSQFVRREEKIRPKLIIRNPFDKWKKQQPPRQK